MKLLLVIPVCVLLSLCVYTSAQAEDWQFDLKLHSFEDFADVSQRLTKHFGNLDLMLAARQFKFDGKQANHLNLSLQGKWFGVEYLTGENVTADLRAFSLFTPSSTKAESFATPCNSVLHTYLHQKFGSGFVQFDHFRKGHIDEMKLHCRAEF